jgi:hypothetical protein
MARNTTRKDDSLVGGVASGDQEPMFVEAPAGPIARAWLAEYSEQLSDDDLKGWLEACPRPGQSHFEMSGQREQGLEVVFVP